jgi:WD40 repeat protein
VRLWSPVIVESRLVTRLTRLTISVGPVLAGHAGPVQWGCWGQVEGRPVLATGSDDGTVRLWDPDRAGPGNDGSPRLRLWDPDSAARAPLGPPLVGHTGTVLWGCWGRAAGRPVLATGGEDGTVRLWELYEERLVSLPGYRSDVGGESDRLARGAEAAALAARSARPPLAIGIFGDWGRARAISWGSSGARCRTGANTWRLMMS